MSLPRYKYNDLHPRHEAWKLAKYWGEEGQELVSDDDPRDTIECIIDNCHPTPIEDLGTIEIFGFAPNPDCPECDLPEEGEPVKVACVIEVDAHEWTANNRPEWL